jgi:hypothetical protein
MNIIPIVDKAKNRDVFRFVRNPALARLRWVPRTRARCRAECGHGGLYAGKSMLTLSFILAS